VKRDNRLKGLANPVVERFCPLQVRGRGSVRLARSLAAAQSTLVVERSSRETRPRRTGARGGAQDGNALFSSTTGLARPFSGVALHDLADQSWCRPNGARRRSKSTASRCCPRRASRPNADAERKVRLIQPRGKVILDTCGGLGYFAAWCLQGRRAGSIPTRRTPTSSGCAASTPGHPKPAAA